MSAKRSFRGIALLALAFMLVTSPTVTSLCMNGSLNDVVVELNAPHDDLGEYSANSNCSVRIAPSGDLPNDFTITVEFVGVETEGCCDGATLHSGPNINAPIVASVSGIQPVNVTVAGPTAFFNFQADASVNRDGILARYYVTGYTDDVFNNQRCPFDCYGRGQCVQGQCVCQSGYVGYLCENDDNKKLFQVYDNCQGSSWTFADGRNWNRTMDGNLCYLPEAQLEQYYNFADWEGLRCAWGRITNMDLSSLGLNCTGHGLPNDTMPRYVETLDLHNALLTGPIPDELFRTSYMTQLNMANTSVEGEIPTGITWAFSLDVLDLSNNHLSGALPSELGYLRSLTELNLENNSFYGFVPDGFGVLKEVAQVFLAGNDFFCPLPQIPQIVSGSCKNVTVDSVDPPTVVSSGGTTVTAKGSGFSAIVPMTCQFGEIASTRTTVIDNYTIECVVPEHVAGSTTFMISSFGKKTSVNALPFSFLMDCSPGTYLSGLNKTQCLPCPDHAVCEGGSTSPYPQYGYHRALAVETYLQCFIPSACPSLPSGACKPGFTGSRCSQCEPGLYLSGDDCITCSGSDMAKPLGIIIFGVLALSALATWMALTGLNFGSAHLLLLLIQVSGLILKIPMNWDSTLSSFSKLFMSANIDLVSVGIGCAFHLDFEQWMTLLLVIPVVFFGVILIMCLTWTTWTVCMRREEKEKDASVRGVVPRAMDTTINAFGCLMVIGHIPLAEQFVAVFECVTDVDRAYMLSDPQVSCYTDEWFNSKKKAIAGCVLYAAGIPFAIFCISTYYRKRLNEPRVLHRYGILFDLYRDSAWWFEGYRSLYSLLVMIIPVMLADSPAMITAVTMVAVTMDKFLIQRVRPFRFFRANSVHAFVVWTFNTIGLAGILFYSQGLKTGQSKGVAVFVIAVISLALIYEFQLLYWRRLIRIPVIGPFFMGPTWTTLFPVRLTERGIEEAKRLEKLPALMELERAEEYPPDFYENVGARQRHQHPAPAHPPAHSPPRTEGKGHEYELDYQRGGSSIKKSAHVMDEEEEEEDVKYSAIPKRQDIESEDWC
ncbi:hypothetical protein HK104_007738 [Borealophlyctis nickersoniae]|nr:hypothetical protein HK104_007738 [Borealophlyctis nickersoniae]